MALSNSVSAGAYIAVSECAYQFRFEKWNCPESAFNLNPVEPFVNKGTSVHLPYSTKRLPSPLHDPLIPKPLPRIGGLKSIVDEKSEMHLSSFSDKSNDDKEASRVDAYELLAPLKRSKDAKDDDDDEGETDDSEYFQDPQIQRQINSETALVRAMTAAGITHTLTKNCSTGDFTNCVCDR